MPLTQKKMVSNIALRRSNVPTVLVDKRAIGLLNLLSHYKRTDPQFYAAIVAAHRQTQKLSGLGSDFSNWLDQNVSSVADSMANTFGVSVSNVTATPGSGSAATTTVATPSSGQSWMNWGKDLIKSVGNAATAYMTSKTQRDLVKTNLKRAEQGLPPIDSASIAPTVNLNVDSAGIGQEVKNYLPYVALGIGGLAVYKLVSGNKKGRR